MLVQGEYVTHQICSGCEAGRLLVERVEASNEAEVDMINRSKAEIDRYADSVTGQFSPDEQPLLRAIKERTYSSALDATQRSLPRVVCSRQSGPGLTGCKAKSQ